MRLSYNCTNCYNTLIIFRFVLYSLPILQFVKVGITKQRSNQIESENIELTSGQNAGSGRCCVFIVQIRMTYIMLYYYLCILKILSLIFNYFK